MILQSTLWYLNIHLLDKGSALDGETEKVHNTQRILLTRKPDTGVPLGPWGFGVDANHPCHPTNVL
jgi:hypothetical protein